MKEKLEKEYLKYLTQKDSIDAAVCPYCNKMDLGLLDGDLPTISEITKEINLKATCDFCNRKVLFIYQVIVCDFISYDEWESEQVGKNIDNYKNDLLNTVEDLVNLIEENGTESMVDCSKTEKAKELLEKVKGG